MIGASVMQSTVTLATALVDTCMQHVRSNPLDEQSCMPSRIYTCRIYCADVYAGFYVCHPVVTSLSSEVVLTGGAMQYKGLLVQGRSGSNPVGSFGAGAQVQPACTSVSVTESSNQLADSS